MRIFFGYEIKSDLSSDFPEGKIIKEKNRHLTLVFLGSVKNHLIDPLIFSFPKPLSPLGFIGIFDKLLFFPNKTKPYVAALHTTISRSQEIIEYRKKLQTFLIDSHLLKEEKRKWIPHVSICRKPQNIHLWEKWFKKSSFIISGLHLYESLGNSTYHSLWKKQLIPPVEKISNTHYKIRGKTPKEIYIHLLYLLFSIDIHFFMLLNKKKLLEKKSFSTIDEALVEINKNITKINNQTKAMIKSVSLIKQNKSNAPFLEWDILINIRGFYAPTY